MKLVVGAAYVLWCVLAEYHDKRWAQSLRNDDYRNGSSDGSGSYRDYQDY